MAKVIKFLTPAAAPFHVDKRHGRPEAQARVAYSSRSVYVGNLAFVTSDIQLHSLFSMAGPVERVIMGLNKLTKQPCGFAYVIFVTREATLDAVRFLNGTVLDERVIKVELDKGYHDGKMWGRGASGGQIRDEMRADYDEGRGGYGAGALSGGKDGGDVGAGADGGGDAGGWDRRDRGGRGSAGGAFRGTDWVAAGTAGGGGYRGGGGGYRSGGGRRGYGGEDRGRGRGHGGGGGGGGGYSGAGGGGYGGGAGRKHRREEDGGSGGDRRPSRRDDDTAPAPAGAAAGGGAGADDDDASLAARERDRERDRRRGDDDADEDRGRGVGHEEAPAEAKRRREGGDGAE